MSSSQDNERNEASVFTFRLPDPGEGLTSAELIEWRVSEGQVVVADQLLLVVETAKTAVEIPSPVSGKVVRFLAKTGDVVAVGDSLLEFEADGYDDSGTFHLVGRMPEPVVAPAMRLPPKPAGAAVKATPTIRRLARSLGISLQDVQGTGAGGSITADDIERAATSTGSAV